MQIAAVKAAAFESRIDKLSEQLTEIVPDLREQYTTFDVDTDLLRTRVRTLHAFQIKLTLRALDLLVDRPNISIVDVGDSSGTHLTYLNSITSNEQRFGSNEFKFLSVNLDPIAIQKIRSKGFNGLLCRAEDIYEKHQIKADLFLSFEMLEHLYDPIGFLDTISRRYVCEYFVLTVPYLRQSRVGLHHIRQQQLREVYPENTHIFELSPSNWKLLFLHCGWEIVEETIYRQYPLRSFWRCTKPIWKKLDFEGMYGAILKRNRTWAKCYKYT